MGDHLRALINENFIEYASYVIKDRAIPHIDDGLKPVQRRILHTLFEVDDGKFHKVANVVGRTMQYHPHGDASIYAALVLLGNKDYFIDKQGNFGNIYTGDSASAARYIECRLTPLARAVLFNKDLTEFIPSYDGRNQEPVTLPAKIPVLLLQGAEGIAVGMSTQILPHNFIEVLEAQIKVLRDQPFELFPDFPTGGTIDVTDYKDGNGKVKVRAQIEARDEKHLIIREIPYGTNTEKLITSIENAIKKNRIKVSSIQDYTAEQVEIELTLPRGVYANQVKDALYAFTDCQISHSTQMVIIKDDRPAILSVSEVLRHNTFKLLDDLKREYEIELSRLHDKLHFKTLEQIFIENRIYKKIEQQDTYEKVIKAVHRGFVPFKEQLLRELTDEDVERLLQIRIKRISKYDIDKNRKEIGDILDRIEQVKGFLADMRTTTIRYIENLLDKYAKGHERRTEIEELTTISRKELVAVQDQKLGYDPDTGYLGTNVKSDHLVTCSRFHKILIVTESYYKVIQVPEKLYLEDKVIYYEKVDKKLVFNCLYRDQTSGIAYVKRFKVEKFIQEKEYQYIPENGKVLLFQADPPPKIKVYYPRKSRSRITQEIIDFAELLVKGATAKGNRVSTKPVSRIRVLEEKTSKE